MAFDTLSYARRLKASGFSDQQAETLADATRELVIQDFARKSDIDALKGGIDALEQRITAAMDNLSLRLTVRMGVMLAAGLSILGAVLKLH
jgi:hypothetical protein